MRPMLSDLNPDDLHYYPFNGSSNIVEDQFGRIRVTQKIQDVNFKVFNMIKGFKNQKSQESIFPVNVDQKLMVENVIQNRNGIIVSADVILKANKHHICKDDYTQNPIS